MRCWSYFTIFTVGNEDFVCTELPSIHWRLWRIERDIYWDKSRHKRRRFTGIPKRQKTFSFHGVFDHAVSRYFCHLNVFLFGFLASRTWLMQMSEFKCIFGASFPISIQNNRDKMSFSVFYVTETWFHYPKRNFVVVSTSKAAQTPFGEIECRRRRRREESFSAHNKMSSKDFCAHFSLSLCFTLSRARLLHNLSVFHSTARKAQRSLYVTALKWS